MQQPNTIFHSRPARPISGRPFPTTGIFLWLGRLVIMPHTLVGIFLLLRALSSWYVGYLGTPTTALVDTRYETAGRHGSMQCHVRCHYTLNGSRYTEGFSLNQSEYAQTPIEMPIPGKALAIAGHALFMRDEGRLGELLGITGMAIFWNGIVSIFLYILWIRPRRRKN